MTTYSISPNPASVNENGGTLTFTVTRSDASSAATVYASTVQDQGYSNPGNEYYTGITNQAVSFAAGQLQATVGVSIKDLGLTSGSETFRFIVQQNTTDPTSTYLATDNFTIHDTDSGGDGGIPEYGVDYRARAQIGTDADGNAIYQYYNPASNSTLYGYSDSTPYISPSAITQAGKSFVIEYIGSAQTNGYLRPDDVTALQSQGLSIASVFEENGRNVLLSTRSGHHRRRPGNSCRPSGWPNIGCDIFWN